MADLTTAGPRHLIELVNLPMPPHPSENELYLKLFITNGGGW